MVDYRAIAEWRKFLKLVMDILDHLKFMINGRGIWKKDGELYEEIGIKTDKYDNVDLMDVTFTPNSQLKLN